MNNDEIKLRETEVRAVVARALEMSGSGYAKNQVTLFLDSLVNDGFYVRRSQQGERADSAALAIRLRALADSISECHGDREPWVRELRDIASALPAGKQQTHGVK